jgi:Zn-dependent peptidase ImmA (M78 family)/transcriptional regulator with XRE-family HTH domain
MGLSITSLADLLGVSKQAVSQYEKGIDTPGPDVFDKMRTILRHEAHFFLMPAVGTLTKSTCFYRSMAAATKTARTKAEVWQMWARELVLYLSEFVVLPRPNFPACAVPADPNGLAMDKVEQYAADLRLQWSLGEKPIANLVSTAEKHGVLIVRHALDAVTLDALSEWLEPEGIPFVILNQDKLIAVRSRLDLAHELGHIVLHRRVTEGQLKKPETFRLIEDQAFRFGAALLLPEHAFLEDLYSVSLDGLRALKPKWKVSIAMMIERLKHLEIITEAQHRKLRINYSTRQWNRNEPFDDEIEPEQPAFLAKAVRMLITENIQSLEEITSSTGFGREWIERLLGLPSDFFSPKQPDIRTLELIRR